MMKRISSQHRGRLAFLALFLIASGCGNVQGENLSLVPPDDLFARAEAAAAARDLDQAIALYDYFVIQYIGNPNAPAARMGLAKAHMEKGEFATAAANFQTFVNDFPFHELALDARLQSCEAYYRLSPRIELDQEYTRSAITHCQSVSEYFPGTEQARAAEARVSEMNNKLARKAYDTGMHYVKRRAYDSAVVYLTDVVASYPRSDVVPAALGQLVDTYTTIGYVEDAQDTRERLLREFPESPEAIARAAGAAGS